MHTHSYIHTCAYRCTDTHAHRSQVLFHKERKTGRDIIATLVSSQASLLLSEWESFLPGHLLTPSSHPTSSKAGAPSFLGQCSGQIVKANDEILSECHREGTSTGWTQGLSGTNVHERLRTNEITPKALSASRVCWGSCFPLFCSFKSRNCFQSKQSDPALFEFN